MSTPILVIILAALALLITLGAAVVAVLWRKRHPDPAPDKKLERTLEQLRAQVEELEHRQRQVPGVEAGEKDWHVLVNGQRVAIKPLTGAEWLRAMKELPSYLYQYARDRVQGKELGAGEFDKIYEIARRWISACAVEEVDLEHLTLPEAEHAITQISALNGIDKNLLEFFREKLQTMPGSRPDRETLWREAQSSPRPEPN